MKFYFDGFIYVIMHSIEWATKYILPWIALYWFIKMVKKMK